MSAETAALLACKGYRNDGAGPGRINELVTGHPNLHECADALLTVRDGLRWELTVREKQTRRICGHADRLVIGPILALTCASAIDDPRRVKSSKQFGAHFGLTPKRR
ncbi:transposase [Bradyrhizobium sp. CCBAU 11386]|uniref:transposase n=1 Tax=Bradyrhizobium sp. CCBAU 11386 TaxID=1630837 RepID=UPI0023035F79|nr:transposase [Bradyrhizobium sp. CCBAU 11386]